MILDEGSVCATGGDVKLYVGRNIDFGILGHYMPTKIKYWEPWGERPELVKMEYFDQELLETKRALERKKYTTLETGMYAGEELITFTETTLPDSTIYLLLPDQFLVMPEKNI